MKIYIIGPPGSGKTTLAKLLSRKNSIKYFQLDLLVFDDENGHMRRSEKEISKMFNKILKKESWIIEDFGRSKFERGIELSDRIYYLKLSKYQVTRRVITRWIKQKCRIENYNYPPTYAQLLDMIKVANPCLKKSTRN